MIDILLDRESGLQMWGEIDPAEHDTAICLPVLSGRTLVKGATNLAWVAVGSSLLFVLAAPAYRSKSGWIRGNCSRIAEQMYWLDGNDPRVSRTNQEMGWGIWHRDFGTSHGVFSTTGLVVYF